MVHLGRPLLIAVLVLTEVGLWQWRMVLAARNHRHGAVLLGGIGAVLQITAITQVVTSVGDPLSVGAYAAGVGLGVLVGLVAGERLTPGTIGFTITTTAPDIAAEMWARGWPAVVHAGHNHNGPVTVLFVPVDQRHEARLRRDVACLAPDAGWSRAELRERPVQPMSASTTRPMAGAGLVAGHDVGTASGGPPAGAPRREFDRHAAATVGGVDRHDGHRRPAGHRSSGAGLNHRSRGQQAAPRRPQSRFYNRKSLH